MEFVVKLMMMLLTDKKARATLSAIFLTFIAALFFYLTSFTGIIGVVLSKEGYFYPMPNNTYVSSEFSPLRFHPIFLDWRAHEGIDMPAPINTAVEASRAGTVRKTVPMHETGGNMIFISHSDGDETRYLHLEKILVEDGDEIMSGQVIGLCGNTGVGTGTHLHFEIRRLGFPIDPAPLLQERTGEFDFGSDLVLAGEYNINDRTSIICSLADNQKTKYLDNMRFVRLFHKQEALCPPKWRIIKTSRTAA